MVRSFRVNDEQYICPNSQASCGAVERSNHDKVPWEHTKPLTVERALWLRGAGDDTLLKRDVKEMSHDSFNQ